MIEIQVSEDADGQRLDKLVLKFLKDVPKSHVYRMFRLKKVRLNGRRGRVEDLVHAGDAVVVRGDEERLLAPRPEGAARARPPAEPLVVLYEDRHLMAVDKPAGMAAHPGSGIDGGTLVEIVREQLGPRAVRNEFAPSPAHRLDRDTSGVILVAKSRRAMVRLTEIFTAGEAHKSYLALVKGHFAAPQGVVDLPLAEHEQSARSRAERGVHMQAAVTRWKALAKGELVTLLECTIETGRTHQIRRHLAAIGHPVAGDRRHGDFPFNRELKSRYGLKRMFLHARRLSIEHPVTAETLRVEAPLPPELLAALKKMGISPPGAPRGQEPHGLGPDGRDLPHPPTPSPLAGKG